MNTEIISGVLTGILSSIIFNPIDKAIYLSTTKNISILNKSVWVKPYKGSVNTISTRIINSGLYFSYLDYYSKITNKNSHVALMTALCCSITNPIQLIKFNSWYNNRSIKDSIKILYKENGYKAFTCGLSPLILRDFIFNYIYITFKKKDNHINNILTICGALTITSPFNLIKNEKYANNTNIKDIIKGFKFNKLGLKYAYVRMGLGFYINQNIYDLNKKLFLFK